VVPVVAGDAYCTVVEGIGVLTIGPVVRVVAGDV